jgi:cysteine desulfurase
MNIYFDNAATTMVCEEASETMLRVMRENYGNPSSPHHMARAAAKELANARKNVAEAIHAQTDEICFTSGGTESVNLAILGCIPTHPRECKHIITSSIEHSAVLESIKKHEQNGYDVTYLNPDSDGRISPESFSAELRDDTIFASIMLVNNETGAVNPISDYSKEIKKRGLKTTLHTDAVQALGKIPVTVKTLGVDLLSMSAHKLHGPKGTGALYIKNGIKLHPLLFGGTQEQKKRPGTEALPAIACFGIAAKLAILNLEKTSDSIRELRNYIINGLKSSLSNVIIIGKGDSPYILNISLPGFKSEVLMNYLDNEGICVNNGSACKKGARSSVLEAMRLNSKIIDGALRISFSRYNTNEEADCLVAALEKAEKTLIRSS